MNRTATYLHALWIAILATTLFASCIEDSLVYTNPIKSSNGVSYNPDGTLGVNLCMEIPGMTGTSTRAMSGTPNYDDLKLYLLVFEEGEGLKQYAQLTPQPYQNDETHGHNRLVTFRLSLEPTEKAATIHLITTDQPDFDKQIGYGTEERVISSLYTNENHEAYWQRIALGFNIPSAEQADPNNKDATDNNKRYDEEAEKNAGIIAEKLSHVPMLRNFCRVSVENNTENFVLTGLYVLNTTDRGSVAPYVAGNPVSQRFVSYLDDTNSYKGKSYDEISEQNHIGTLPIGVQVINKLGSDIQSKSEGDVSPVYFYERPARVNSTERTYVIIRGKYTDNTGTTTEGYYKLDLGYIKPDDIIGAFEYYNLLRNFDYKIRLNNVSAPGYASLEAASKGSVFNNFAASVEARNMTSISDGEDMIFVNFTSYVFVKPNDIAKLLAQYRIEVNDGKGGVVRNDLLKIKWESGEVINSITGSESITENGTEWNKYTVKSTGEPTSRLKQQTVYIYRGNRANEGEPVDYGLYRVINFFSHTPWSFEHIDTYPGLWESMDDMPSWDWSESMREIDYNKGAELTLFFELPPALPQAIFPLEFVIESDRQNIQNAYEGNAVVRSVPADSSLFATNPTLGNPPAAPTTPRIQYVKTLTWEAYNNEVVDEQAATGSPVVRCRFRTITDLEHENVGTNEDGGSRSTTRLRVYNPYFGKYDDESGTWTMYHEDGFKRYTSVELIWDFTNDYDNIWSDILTEMNSRYDIDTRYNNYKIYTSSSNETDGLIFVDGTVKETVYRFLQGFVQIDKPTISNGIDSKNLRYVQTSSVNDILKRRQSYTVKEKRTMRVSVMSTDANGNSAPPRIEFSNVKGGTVANPTGPTNTDNSEEYTSYVYDIDIAEGITELDLDIKPPTSNPNMRFYKISFSPKIKNN